MQQGNEHRGRELQQPVQDRAIVSEYGSAAFPAFSPMVYSVFLPGTHFDHKLRSQSLISALVNDTVLVSARGYACSE